MAAAREFAESQQMMPVGMDMEMDVRVGGDEDGYGSDPEGFFRILREAAPWRGATGMGPGMGMGMGIGMGPGMGWGEARGRRLEDLLSGPDMRRMKDIFQAVSALTGHGPHQRPRLSDSGLDSGIITEGTLTDGILDSLGLLLFPLIARLTGTALFQTSTYLSTLLPSALLVSLPLFVRGWLGRMDNRVWKESLLGAVVCYVCVDLGRTWLDILAFRRITRRRIRERSLAGLDLGDNLRP